MGKREYMAVSDAGHAAARAIDDLYRAHASDVYRYALAVLGHPADAEDVTQTTFLNAYRALEQGVRPRKPSNWLLRIATNVMKERFRAERSASRAALVDDRLAGGASEDASPTISELMTALRRIPPTQRQAIVLREFEGRSYREIAEILAVTTSALETLLFRARKSLAEELESQPTCTDAQFALSRAADSRLGRKERRRLREHLDDCPDCARFARLQQRNRRAFRGLALVPVPVSIGLLEGLDAPTAAAATLPAGGAIATVGSGGAAGAAGGVVGGTVALKAAAVVSAASVAGGVGLAGSVEVEPKSRGKAPVAAEMPGERLGQVAPRGVSVPGRGVAVGKAPAREKPGRRIGALAPRPAPGRAKSAEKRDGGASDAPKVASKGRSADAKATARKTTRVEARAAKASAAKARALERSTSARGENTPSRADPRRRDARG